jgi:hypothetical protein
MTIFLRSKPRRRKSLPGARRSRVDHSRGLADFRADGVDGGVSCAHDRAVLLGSRHADLWHDRDVPTDQCFHLSRWLKRASSPGGGRLTDMRSFHAKSGSRRARRFSPGQPAGASRMRRFISGGGRSTTDSNTNPPNMS